MGDGNVAEKFDYEKVSAEMNKIVETRTNARRVMDSITELLSAEINNSDTNDRALGGNTKAIWDEWNTFYEEFSQFGESMDKMYQNVLASSATNKAFEAGNAGTINTAVTSSVEQ